MLESELFALLEHTADAAYTVTSDGEICSWNAAAERLFGLPAVDVLRRNIDDVLDARDALGTEALAGGLEAATRHWDGKAGIPNFDLEVSTQPGKHIWINVSTIVFDNPPIPTMPPAIASCASPPAVPASIPVTGPKASAA